MAGGDVTVGKDDDNPISSPGDNQSSVVLNDEGDYPYFCLVHTTNMTGVIFVRASPPTDFNKSDPANGANNQSTSLSLTWESSDGATSYDYCINQSLDSICNDGWNSVNANTTVDPPGLINNTTYQWQVRAVNDNGMTEANDGSWWQFTTVVAPPEAFDKTSPADSATGQSSSPTLVWSASAGAVRYEYCIDMSDNDSCISAWTVTGLNTSAVPPELSADTEYYWQARAVNPGGTTAANGGTWWQFRTQIAPPAAFNKSSPANGANNQPTDLTLTWQASGGAAEYEYCIDTTVNNCGASWTPVLPVAPDLAHAT